MALYSWFLRDDKKPVIKKTSVNNDLTRTSNSTKYIENYTMWPTAKIKADVEITPPNYANLNGKSLKHQKATLPITTALTIIKVK